MKINVPTRFVNEHGDVGTLYKEMTLDEAAKGGQLTGLDLSSGELIFRGEKEVSYEWLEERRLDVLSEIAETAKCLRKIGA